MSDSSIAKNAQRIVDADHPWLGLTPFTAATKEYFFGRDQEIRDLFLRVREQPLTILYGQSGLGKTSLLGAGLIPKLTVEGFAPRTIRLSYEAHDPPLVQQTLNSIGALKDSTEPKDNSNAPATLWEMFHYLPTLSKDIAEHPPVLIFDQFEELFTLTESTARQREANEFFIQLADLIENRPPTDVQQRLLQNRRLAMQYDLNASPMRVVLALREDYLSHLENWKKMMPSLMRNRVGIYQLSGPQALEAVVRPGRREGRNLVNDDVGADIVRFVAKRDPGTPLSEIAAVPPILSLLCDELNQSRLSNGQSQVTAQLVAAQSEDILQNFYNRAFDGLPPQVRRLVEDRMVTVGGHRNPVAREDVLSELSSQGVMNPQAALDQLILGRLLSSEERGGVQRVEITHDVLAPLVVHSRDDRRAREQIEHAQREREEARRQRRRFQRIAAVMIALTTIAIIGSAVAIAASIKARDQELLATKQTAIAKEKTKEAEKQTQLVEKSRIETEKLLAKQVEQTLAASKLVFEFGVAEYEGGRLRSGTDKIHQAWSVREDDDPLKTSYGRVLVDRLTRGGRSHVLLPHPEIIAGIALSADGTHLATASIDNIVRIWDTTTGTSVGMPILTNAYVWSIAFSPNGTRVAFASDDGIRLYDISSNFIPVDVMMDKGYSADVVAFSPDGTRLAGDGSGNKIKIWDAATGKPLAETSAHQGSIKAIAFSPDGTRLVSGSYDKTSKIWETEMGTLVGEMEHEGAVWSLAYSPDGKSIATGTDKHVARLWDALSNAPIGSPMMHDSEICDVKFNPSGTCLVTGCADGGARLWDTSTCTQKGITMMHGGLVASATFSPDGSRVATSSYDNTCRIWDAATGEPLGEPMRHDHRVDDVIFSPDGTRVVSASWDHTVRIWDAITATPTGELIPHGNVDAITFSDDGIQLTTIFSSSEKSNAKVWSLADNEAIELKSFQGAVTFSPDGSRFVSIDGDDGDTVTLRDSGTSEQIGPSMKHDNKVSLVQFSRNGRRLMTISGSVVRVWDGSTAVSIGEPMQCYGTVIASTFSPDGSRVATAAEDYVATIWDASSGTSITECVGHNYRIGALSFNPDGQRLVTASDDKTARIWDVATGKLFGQPMEHENEVISVTFSPDGTRVATGTANECAHIWDSMTCKSIGQPIKHSYLMPIIEVLFSPDSNRLATAAMDKTLKLSEASTAAALGVVMPQPDDAKGLAFSPDGNRLATGSFGDKVSIWDFPSYPSDLKKYIEVLSAIDSGRIEHDASFDGWLEEHLKETTFKNRHSIAVQAYAKEDWFAAAFHLRWLCQQKPENERWRKMLEEAEKRLKEKAAPRRQKLSSCFSSLPASKAQFRKSNCSA